MKSKTMRLRPIIMLYGSISVIFIVIFFLAFIRPSLEKKFYEYKKEGIQNATTALYSTMLGYHKVAQAKVCTEEEAQQKLIKAFSMIRYGELSKDEFDIGNEYFFILDKDGTMLLNPATKSLEGTNCLEIRDSKGKYIFKEMLQILEKNKDGFLTYNWKTDKHSDSEKLTYIRRFTPWNWIIGTGVYTEHIKESLTEVRWVSIISLVGLAIIIIISSFILSWRITNPINKTIDSLYDLSKGNLNTEISFNSYIKELRFMKEAFLNLKEQLVGIVTSAQDTAILLSTASEEIAQTTTSISDNAQTQASSVEEITATIEELASSSDNIVHRTSQQTVDIVQLKEKMQKLKSIVESAGSSMMGAMKIKQDLSSLTDKTKEVVKLALIKTENTVHSSEMMKDITNIITDIADNINLLSLNANIEASRAGEAGKGFEVIAREIGKLSTKTTDNVKEIDTIISSLFVEIKELYNFLNTASEGIIKMIAYITQFGDAIDAVATKAQEDLKLNSEVNKDADDVLEETKNISSGIQEQKIAIDEIMKSVTVVNENTQLVASGSEQLASSSENLASVAEQLREKIDWFKK